MSDSKGFELTEVQEKKLKAIEKKMKALNAEIRAMGFSVYLANSTVNIMKGPSHDDSRSTNALQHNSIWSFMLSGWDGGDW